MTIKSPIAAGSLCRGTNDGRINGIKTVRNPLAIPKNKPIATTYSYSRKIIITTEQNFSFKLELGEGGDYKLFTCPAQGKYNYAD